MKKTYKAEVKEFKKLRLFNQNTHNVYLLSVMTEMHEAAIS